MENYGELWRIVENCGEIFFSFLKKLWVNMEKFTRILKNCGVPVFSKSVENWGELGRIGENWGEIWEYWGVFSFVHFL